MKIVTFFAFLCCFISCSTTLFGQADDPETAYNDQQVAIVKRGYKVLAAYQKVYKEKNGELPKLNLKEAELAGVDFRGMNLDNADFRDADLRAARFGDKPAIRTKKYDNEDRLISGQAPVPAASLRNADFRAF